MLECSYKFGGEFGWRVSLSGAADFDSGSSAYVRMGGIGHYGGLGDGAIE